MSDLVIVVAIESKLLPSRYELDALKINSVKNRMTEVQSSGKQSSASFKDRLLWLYSNSLLISWSFRFHRFMTEDKPEVMFLRNFSALIRVDD